MIKQFPAAQYFLSQTQFRHLVIKSLPNLPIHSINIQFIVDIIIQSRSINLPFCIPILS